MPKNYVRVTLSISREDAKWLDDHPEYSKSGIMRRVIGILRNDPEYIEKMERKIRTMGVRI